MGYDIPKLYFLEVKRDSGVEFEVIDGQQRLRAIWEFCDDQYKLDKNMKMIANQNLGGLKFSELDREFAMKINNYSLDVVLVSDVIQNEHEDEVREMFLRLQKGTNLKAQEKRNAMLGKMRGFVKEVANHNFFTNCNFKNARFTYDLVAAQVICLELSGEPINVRDKELNEMYENNKSFSSAGVVAKQVKNVLNFLERVFPEKTPELTRYNVIALYCLSSSLLKSYVNKGIESKIKNWFIEFESHRSENDKLPLDQQDIRLIDYKGNISHSTDSKESIQKRLRVPRRIIFYRI